MLLSTSSRLQWGAGFLTIALGMTFLAAPTQAASDIKGIWLTAERDGDVEIKPCGDALCGYIVTILDPEVPPDSRDIYNEDSKLRSRPICGLKILEGLKDQGESWEGLVYDPHEGRGKNYSVDVKLKDADTLNLLGYIGVKLLGETQLWTRDRKAIQRCKPPPNKTPNG
jgi:uncharacterized protein (DUF2147 family)